MFLLNDINPLCYALKFKSLELRNLTWTLYFEENKNKIGSLPTTFIFSGQNFNQTPFKEHLRSLYP